jgi:hypothetical protein
VSVKGGGVGGVGDVVVGGGAGVAAGVVVGVVGVGVVIGGGVGGGAGGCGCTWWVVTPCILAMVLILRC